MKITMRKLTLLIFINVFITGSLYSQSGWNWVHPYPQGHELKSAQFVNPELGFAAGEGGNIIKTTNGGVNWEVIWTGTSDPLYTVYFVNSQTGFVAGGYSGGIIKKTTNSGENWSTVYTGFTNSFRSICFTNDSSGYVVGNSGSIRKTVDWGNTWFSQNSQLGINLKKVTFLNSDTGFVFAESRIILKTTNGGSNWSWNSYNFTSSSFADISFTSYNNWYILGSGSIVFKSTDAGANWTGLYTGDNTGFSTIHFFDENTGIITGGDKIRKTTNGGTTWVNTALPGLNLRTLSFLNPDIGLSTGTGGQIYKTMNGGISWSSMQTSSSRIDFNSIYFINQLTGFAAGGNGTSYNIMRTTDGGSLWTTMNSGYNYYNTDVDFKDNWTGYVTNTNGKIYITNDGGASWTGQNVMSGLSLTTVDFKNSSTGYVSTSNGKVYKTENGGYFWTQLSETGFGGYIYSLVMSDDNTVFCVGSGGTILKTSNGGLSWISQVSGTSNHLLSVFFNDLQTGYACGNYTILKTTNGGDNWNSIRQNNGESLSSIMFTDNLTGYACGSGGLILKTTDAGITWNKQNSKTSFGLSRIFFVNSGQGFVCGVNGTILSTSTGGLTGSPVISKSIPNDFYLKQNFPNPFNPATNIEFGIPASQGKSKLGFVSLKIYDGLGKEVRTLVNENLSPGSYKLKFDGNNLSSGIYFYKLEIGGFAETKRMILLK